MAGIAGKSGRKSSGEEQETRKICMNALEAKYGSIQKAVERLLSSEEPALVKFVYEHALGKPQDKVEFAGKNVTIKVHAE
jgi:hypothetical protein